MKSIKWYVFIILMTATTAYAQNLKEQNNFTTQKVNLVFGLNQPLLSGFNLEGNLFWNRLVIDYSTPLILNISIGYSFGWK